MPDTSKIWKLAAPDFSALDSIWRNPLPFVLWPVGMQPLLAHWMDEAVRRGFDEVEVYVADRPTAVRVALEEGVYWSRPVRVIPVAGEADAPADAECVDRLPNTPADKFSGDARALLQRWFELQTTWMAGRDGGEVSLERQVEGGWIGHHASVHPQAKLTAPFWIGPNAQIGPRCRVGPNAIIAENSILGEDVEVEEACVLANTYLGHHTRLCHALADGGALVDWARGCRVDIGESFVMRPVKRQSCGPGLLERAAAFIAYGMLAPFAKLWNRAGWTSREIVVPQSGAAIPLLTGSGGPLWARRWPWLWEIARGRFRWIGILPRDAEHWKSIPSEVLSQLQSCCFGMFSLADLHGCHDPSDPEESIHAIYQGLQADSRSREWVAKNLWKIAWSR